MIIRRTILALIAAAALANAAGLTFDVASVKISKAPDAAVLINPGVTVDPSGRLRVPSIGGHVNINNWTLSMCILAAWDLGSSQLSGPAWLGEDRYDIAAQASPQTTQADLRIMLQALLAERFKLATHRETKELPGYVLVTVKGGPKLHAPTSDQQLPVIFAPPSRLIGNGSTMQNLAMVLRRPAGRPVVDKTGITGAWDFTLSWSPDEKNPDAGPSIFTALQEQLGLRLEPLKQQMDALVVDHAERIPTTN